MLIDLFLSGRAQSATGFESLSKVRRRWAGESSLDRRIFVRVPEFGLDMRAPGKIRLTIYVLGFVGAALFTALLIHTGRRTGSECVC